MAGEGQYAPRVILNAHEAGANGTDIVIDEPPVESIGVQLKSRAAKKKARKQAAAMKPAAPATTITRGFDTPSVSAGEDSDRSPTDTPPRLDVKQGSSPFSSPSMRPSSLTRAISGLRLNEDAAEQTVRGRSPLASNAGFDSQVGHSSPLVKLLSEDEVSDSSGLEGGADTYEVPLESDFASVDHKSTRFLSAIEGGLRTDSPHRKMTASDFVPLKCLGKGAYGTVLLVKQRSTGRLFAQKQLKKATLTVHKRLVEQTRSERAILESVNRHPFVVKLYYAFQDHQKLYLILEYAQGGELFHHLRMERMFSEEVAAFYMAEMILALDHLHRSLGVVYRDLKPENCLLDAEGHLLLTDFGLSKVAVTDSDSESSRCNTMQIGTIDYMAPEVVKGDPYDAAVDWWSLGALGYDLMTGAPPFASANWTKTQQKIIHGGKITMPYYLGPDAKDLLLRLLKREPKKRLGANMPKDLTTIKAHRFFRRINWKALEKREDVAPPIQPIITDPEAAENFAEEFTGCVMSPVEDRSFLREAVEDGDIAMGDNPFGGFTFVASNSLLECGMLE